MLQEIFYWTIIILSSLLTVYYWSVLQYGKDPLIRFHSIVLPVNTLQMLICKIVFSQRYLTTIYSKNQQKCRTRGWPERGGIIYASLLISQHPYPTPFYSEIISLSCFFYRPPKFKTPLPLSLKVINYGRVWKGVYIWEKK